MALLVGECRCCALETAKADQQAPTDGCRSGATDRPTDERPLTALRPLFVLDGDPTWLASGGATLADLRNQR